MLLFISGAEIFFIFFVILLVFGADKIPSFARTLAKGIVQVKQATNEINTPSINEFNKNDSICGKGMPKIVLAWKIDLGTPKFISSVGMLLVNSKIKLVAR